MEISYAMVVAIILGLSQWVKEKTGLVDKTAEIVCAALGFVLMGVYQFTVTNPTDLNSAFVVLVAALSGWLVPSGLYKLTTSFVEKTK